MTSTALDAVLGLKPKQPMVVVSDSRDQEDEDDAAAFDAQQIRKTGVKLCVSAHVRQQQVGTDGAPTSV